MPTLWGKTYTRSGLLRHVGDLRQLAGVQSIELSDGRERGVRAVNVRNAAGLAFTVITDRGMSLTDLRFQGVPLPFISGVDVAHPAYAEHTGLGWFRTWPAGFSTPCGLTQVGSPHTDNGEDLGVHGRVSSLPASHVRCDEAWQGDDYVLSVQGIIRQTAVFGENLVLQRRIWTKLDQPCLWIEDTIENRGFSPAPLMFLQHFNLGFPLVDATARLELPPHTTEPRDEAARSGLKNYREFSAPVVGYAEQVFYHDLTPDPADMIEVRFINPAFNANQGLGVALRYAKSDYPIFAQWKMMSEGLYVVGLEPANCHVAGRAAERERGTLQLIEPQATRTFNLEVIFF
ncbi:MAG: aldose 1-epimerase family protein [Chloroflexi bacterium]|nr:aldose 1-epimerase family protein [Chloroflexota bacterium]